MTAKQKRKGNGSWSKFIKTGTSLALFFCRQPILEFCLFCPCCAVERGCLALPASLWNCRHSLHSGRWAGRQQWCGCSFSLCLARLIPVCSLIFFHTELQAAWLQCDALAADCIVLLKNKLPQSLQSISWAISCYSQESWDFHVILKLQVLMYSEILSLCSFITAFDPFFSLPLSQMLLETSFSMHYIVSLEFPSVGIIVQ